MSIQLCTSLIQSCLPEAARKYFGESSPASYGEIVTDCKSKAVFKVTGIIEQAPSTSHFQYDLLTSIILMRV
jgi:hypothetical protein